MKVTLGQIAAAVEGFNKLSQSKLPVKSSFRIAKLAKAIGAEYALYEEQRVALIKRLGEEDKGGNFEIKTEEAKKEFFEELKPLIETEVEVVGNKLTFADLGSLELSPIEIDGLLPFIEDEVTA